MCLYRQNEIQFLFLLLYDIASCSDLDGRFFMFHWRYINQRAYPELEFNIESEAVTHVSRAKEKDDHIND